MRNLLALMGAALVTFAAVGWYLDWYRIRTEPAASGHRQVEIDFNGTKIQHDLEKGRDKLRDLLDSKAKDPTAAVPAQAAPDRKAPTGDARQPGATPPAPPAAFGEEFVLPPPETPAPGTRRPSAPPN